MSYAPRRSLQQDDCYVVVGRRRVHTTPTRDAIDLRFRSGGSMTIPRRIVPGLEDVPASALGPIRVSLAGDALTWPSLDVDVYVPGLVERAFDARLFARTNGTARWSPTHEGESPAARANGAKGGRPRKRLSA